MEVSVRRVEDVSVIDLKGKFYSESGPALLPTVRQILDGGGRRFVLNMTEVSRMDSTAVAEIVSAYKEVQEKGGRLVVCSIRFNWPPVRQTLQVLKAIYDSEVEAIASF